MNSVAHRVDPRPEPRKGRRVQLRWRLAATVAVLVLIGTVLPLEELVTALRKISLGVWAVAILTYLVLHLIGAAKWWLLMRSAGAELSCLRVIRCYYFGLFGNIFLPSLVGGDLVRTGLAVRLARSKTGVILGSVVDRIVDVLGLAAIVGIGTLTMSRTLDGQSQRVFVGFAMTVVVVGIAGIVLFATLPARRFPMKIRRVLVKVRVAVSAMQRNLLNVVLAWFLAISLQLLLVVLCAWLGGYVGVDATLSIWLFVWPLAKLSALVPLTQGGIGVREATQAGLFAPFGVSAVAAVAAGLVFEVVIISGGLAGGLISSLLARAMGTSLAD